MSLRLTSWSAQRGMESRFHKDKLKKKENTNMNSKTHKHTMRLMHDCQSRQGWSSAFTKPNWKKEKKIQVHKCKFRHHIKILLQSKGWPRMASQVGSEVYLYRLHLYWFANQFQIWVYIFSIVSSVCRFPLISSCITCYIDALFKSWHWKEYKKH